MLLGTQALQSSNGIAAPRRRLVAFLIRRTHHFLGQRPLGAANVAPQNICGCADQAGIFLRADLTRTDTAATIHLIINTRSFHTDITWKAPLAVRQSQCALQRPDHRINRRNTGIRTEIPPFIILAPPRHQKRRILPVRNFDIRVRFCILEADIVFGRIPLDQRIFQCQRFNLGRAHVIVKIAD